MIAAFLSKEKNWFTLGALSFLLLLLVSFITDIPFLYVAPLALGALAVFVSDVRIAFFALMACIPVSVQYQDKYDLPDEALMLLLTLMFVFFCLFNLAKLEWKKLLFNPILILILLMYAWLIVAVLCSEDPLLSVKFLLKKTWYLVPFFFFPLFLFRQKPVMIRAYQYLFISLFLVVIVVLVRFSAVGFAFEKVHDPVQPFFQNHVMYGSMVSVTIPFVVVALFLSRFLSIQWLLSLGGLFVFLFAVYFSYSRAAWMAVLFAAGVVVLVRLKLMHIAILVFFGLVLTGVLWMAQDNRYLGFKPRFEKTIMHESLEDHIMATIQGTDISSAERYYRWIAAVRMSTERPWTGVGPNNFYEYYKAYTITSFRTWVSRNPERSTTHNYFLFMLVEQGYPAMVLYAALIFTVFFYGQRVYHRQKERFYKLVVLGALACVGAVFINNFFSELLETDKIGSMFFLSLAVLVVADRKAKRDGMEGEPA